VKTSTKIILVDHLNSGEINDDSLAAGNTSKDSITGETANDIVPPFSNNLDGRMWHDRLDDTIGNDLLFGGEANEKSL
jgi:Ca2+-binding RTX toxin-like protein